MSKATRATRALEAAGVAFRLHSYAYDPDADSIGMQAAEALGAEPGRVLKTLMVMVDGKPALVIAPSDREVSMKRLAAAFRGKAATMTPPVEAERISGYVIGGISPFGQKRRLPVAIDLSAMAYPAVFINGGQRGLQIEAEPAAIAAALQAIVAQVTA